jgi:hypothetical protein
MSASAVVLAGLNAAYGSASSKAGLAAIAEGEGGATFTILFGGSQWTGSLDRFPNWPGKAVGNSETHAAGFVQFEPASYAEAAVISGRSAFYPQDQIQNGWDYAATIFKARSGLDLHAVLEAGGSKLALVTTYLLPIWPGGCDGGFAKRFNANLPLVHAMQGSPASGDASAWLGIADMTPHVASISLGTGRGRKLTMRS